MLSCPRCALAIWRKADHSACILLDIAAVQVSCSMLHKEAHFQRSSVMNWCSQDLVHPPINNKLGTSIHWWSMFLFLWLILCMACHLCHIYHQHNQDWETIMCITLGSTLTFLHQCWVRRRYCLAGTTKLGEQVAKNTKLKWRSFVYFLP